MKVDITRWMYRSGRPNRVAAVLNRWWAIVWSAGLGPNRMAALEVRGRRTGRLISFPVVVAGYQGDRYLVAMLGEATNWVSNVRAAGGQAVLRHGGREPVHLEEVDPRARAPILRRYLHVAPGGRAHVPVDQRAPLADFERVAAQYPVFRIRAACTRRTAAPPPRGRNDRVPAAVRVHGIGRREQRRPSARVLKLH